ncbi:hypothetical protein [Streptantibioticus silvisoli]|uniref:Uncharacterized protein n=1 Tax=Streptantibioticus silvisoli TaxID=2705255 RepID=A0ABT6VRL7_9ACTN|nr:hypothetical protein [Streptantibioticus silvisoli]MDI5961124.1 hypothetical protein [Streptantibioticus silvisoli]
MESITNILAESEQGVTDATETLEKLQGLLEQIRHTPEGADRISRMNAFVRTLGRADNLAAFLELMRTSLKSGRPSEHDIAERSRAGRAHCIYGWAGQSLVLASENKAIASTTPAGAGVEEFMGYPVAEWHASIHIWQPNPEAQGFESTKRLEPGAIVEPAHSHPFAFVSYVSVGEMRQSIYQETSEAMPAGATDRYQDVALERVDGVWPPHQEYVSSRLRTAEERVLLKQGESYFMSNDQIHDVEVDRKTAADRPTITLFLCSETTRIANSYMVPSMAEFHRDNPELTSRAKALDPEEWDAKLDATARYLRGESDHLRLGEVFECGSSYAFMNV